MPTQASRSEIIDLINAYIVENSDGNITATQVNELLTLLVNSFINAVDENPTLESVLTADPTTGRPIQWDNGSAIKKGTFSNGTGAGGGVSIKGSEGYELNIQGGRLGLWNGTAFIALNVDSLLAYGFDPTSILTGLSLVHKNYVDTGLSSKQATLVSGTNLKTVGGTSLLGTGDIPVAGTGMIGIANSLGSYTFYSTFAAAMSAASSGQTIEFFTDIVETSNVAINLKDGVNINGNGHTYTLNVAGTANCIQDNAVAVNCSISNITFKRIGGTASSTNTLCMYITGASTIKMYGSNLIGGATNIRCLTINNAGAQVYGVYAEGYNPVILVTNGQLYDSTAKSLGGTGITVSSTGTAIKCISYGLGADGLVSAGRIIDCIGYGSVNNGLSISGGLVQNCTGFSAGGAGIYINSSSVVALNSTGYSIAGNGISTSGSANIGLQGYSTVNYGISIINGVLIDCTGYSTASAGIRMENSGATICELRSCRAISTAATAISQANTTSGCKIIKTEAICRWNNASGHGITLLGDNTIIVQCTIDVVNSSANGIYAASALNAKTAQNAFIGCTTMINANITQTASGVEDSQGNILI